MDALLSPVSQTREGVDRAGKSLTPAESGVHVQGGYSVPIVMSARSGPEAEETHCVLSGAPRRRSAHPAQLCSGPAQLCPGPAQLCLALPRPLPPAVGWLTQPALPTTSCQVGPGRQGAMWAALLLAVSLLILFAPIMSSKPL